jgi:cobalt/nickel transport system permease protein
MDRMGTMIDFDRAFLNLGFLDTLSYRNTLIHRLDPRTKVLVTLALIVTTVSYPKYEVTGLIPLFLFPVLFFALGDIPVWLIVKKVLVVSVFVVFVGLFNPLFDRHVLVRFWGIPVSGGWVSFISILIRCLLTIGSVLLLVATTSFPGICHALRKLGVPEIFVSQLLFLYRYVFVLMEETLRMVRARDMRSFGGKGHGMRIFISLIGTLFVRTVERAERIHQAMLSRGFSGTVPFLRGDGFRRVDFVVLAFAAAALAIFRTCDLVNFIGRQAERIF